MKNAFLTIVWTLVIFTLGWGTRYIPQFDIETGTLERRVIAVEERQKKLFMNDQILILEMQKLHRERVKEQDWVAGVSGR